MNGNFQAYRQHLPIICLIISKHTKSQWNFFAHLFLLSWILKSIDANTQYIQIYDLISTSVCGIFLFEMGASFFVFDHQKYTQREIPTEHSLIRFSCVAFKLLLNHIVLTIYRYVS